MTDPDEHPYINYASAPKYAGVGDYIIQTLMTAASAALQEEARLKPAEAAAAQQAAMAQVLIPADARTNQKGAQDEFEQGSRPSTHTRRAGSARKPPTSFGRDSGGTPGSMQRSVTRAHRGTQAADVCRRIFSLRTARGCSRHRSRNLKEQALVPQARYVCQRPHRLVAAPGERTAYAVSDRIGAIHILAIRARALGRA